MVCGYLEKKTDIFNKKYINTTGKILSLIIPISGIVWYSFINLNILSVASIGICILLFHINGIKKATLSIDALIDSSLRRRIYKFHPIFKSIILIIIIVTLVISMCESTVYLEENGERQEVMADVAKITVLEDKVICQDIMGEAREVVNARIKEANLVDHSIILEKK